jgi:hypothetical protein
MGQINRMAAGAGLLALVTAGHADTILRQRSFDLSRAGDSSYFQNYKTTVQKITTDEEGLTSAQLTWPVNRSSFGRTSPSYHEDWSPYNIIEFKMHNRDSFRTTFKILVYLNQSPSDGSNMFSTSFTLEAGQTQRYVCYLNAIDGLQYGLEHMRPVLSAPFANLNSSGGNRNLSHIYTWRLSYQGTSPAHVDISELRLLQQNPVFDGMVDTFGQYSDREWANKIHNVSDFAGHRAAELTDLAANPDMGEEQGTEKLPNNNPVTGKWTVTRSSAGNYYLQHPNGNLFWMLGITAINNGVVTPVGGRENYFQFLPDSSSKFSTLYKTMPTMDGNNTCYTFVGQNLMLKYGDNYTTPWVSTVKARLGSWGLNTVGIQSMNNFYDNSTPYTQLLSTSNFPKRLKVPHQIWGSMPDPFDSSFVSWMTTNFPKTLAPYNGQSNFAGVYVDNEMAWGTTASDKLRYNIELGTFKAPSSQAAKVAMVNFFNDRYNGSITSLNTAWGSKFTSFDNMLSTTYAPTTFTTKQASDFQAWTKAFAVQYYSSVRSALNSLKLSGLYLGSRNADWLPEQVQGADPYVDVHSFNAYRHADNFDFATLENQSKPYMFSEMGYSVDADGTFGGVAECYSQADRATYLQEFLQKANSMPHCVGATLYCYTDQPITGRYSDYENSGLGLVDITDTPHYEAVNVLRNFAKTMYTGRG